MEKLKGKVALITGAAGGIGRATSKLFIEEGAKGVALLDIWDEMGEKIAAELGSNAVYIHTDVTQESDIKKAIELIIEKFGRLDIVFSNAGNPGPRGAIEDISIEDFDKTIAIHLRAKFLFMKYAIPIMKKQGSGCFIMTSSVAGFQHGYGPLPYSLSKAAINNLARYAAVELGIFGIRVNAIAPGGIATGIYGKGLGISNNGAEKVGGLIKEILAEQQAIRRAGLPEDVANVALFLASDSSSFITGETFKVDGGLLSGRIPQDPQETQNKWLELIQELDPEDQKIIAAGMQETMKKTFEDLKYMKPEIRETIMKRIQKMAESRKEV